MLVDVLFDVVIDERTNQPNGYEQYNVNKGIHDLITQDYVVYCVN